MGPLPQTGVGPPIDPLSYHDVAAGMSATPVTNETTNQFSTIFYQDMSSGVPSFNGIEPVDLKTVPGSGIFDMSEPGSDLNKNVQRLEQMGNGEFVNSSLRPQSNVDVYPSEEDIYPQPAAEVYTQEKTDEGHFIPDDAGQDDSCSPFGYDSSLYESQTIKSENEPFPAVPYHPTDSGTEILQAASELHAHIGDREDRPSFMSSSPPPLSAFHHPDIIPSSSADSSQASNENQSDSGVSSEQGESNVANSFMNTSPIHRNNPAMDNSGVPHFNTLHDIAQHSYTVPSGQDSGVTHSVSQLDIDPVQNTDSTSNDLSLGNSQSSHACYNLDEASFPMTFESGDSKILDTAEQSGTFVSEIKENNGNDDKSNNSAESVTPKLELNQVPINLSVQPPVVQNLQQQEDNEQVSDPDLTPTGTTESQAVECLDLHPTQSEDKVMQDISLSSQQLSSCDTTPTNSDTYQDITSLDKSQTVSEIMPEPTDSKFSSEEKSVGFQERKESSSQSVISENTELSGAFNEPNSTALLSDSRDVTCDTDAANILTQLQTNDLTMSEADVAAVDFELAALEQEIAKLKQRGDELKGTLPVSTPVAFETHPVPSRDASIVNETHSMPSRDISVANETHPVPSCDNSAGSDTPKIVNATVDTSQTHAISISDSKPEQKSAISKESDTPTPETVSTAGQLAESMGTRRDSGESVERFLAPAILSPGIATPMDDPGFTKVPGFQSALDSMTEEEEQVSSNANASGSAGVGAVCEVRPKGRYPRGYAKK